MKILLAFIPLFVAMDPIGILPFFASMTRGMGRARRQVVIHQSVGTSLLLSVGFLFLGKTVFEVLGITVSDFQVAGGIILLVLAVHDLLFSGMVSRLPNATVGIVPIGIPLIVGPAVLTILLLANDAYGVGATLVALGANLLLVWLVFSTSDFLLEFLGEGGAKAFGKVASLLLASIAVMMIRVGLTAYFRSAV